MEFKGKVEDVFTKSFTKKDGTTAEIKGMVVKETEGEYPQVGVFELSDKITTQFAAGDLVDVEFNLSGRLSGVNWYGSNKAWRVKKESTTF